MQPTYTHFGVVEGTDGEPLKVIGFADEEAADDWRWRWSKGFPYSDNYDHSIKVADATDPVVKRAVEKRLVEDPSTHYREWEAWDAAEKVAYEAWENEREQREAEAREKWEKEQQANAQSADCSDAAPTTSEAAEEVAEPAPVTSTWKRKLAVAGLYRGRIATNSSSLAWVRYRRGAGTLDVGFHHGGAYRYFGVSPQELNELLSALSIGRHFNAHLRNRKICSTLHLRGRARRGAASRAGRSLARTIKREVQLSGRATARAARALGPSHWKVRGTWVKQRNGRRHWRSGTTAHRRH